MLRVTVVDKDAGLELLVEGKLIRPSVSELEAIWKQTRQSHGGRPFVINLSGMTAIDGSGKEALICMIRQGARLTSMGVFNKHLIHELVSKSAVVGISRDKS